jgi:hypothetical protein
MMYRHCIYCSADLGANAQIESFPVGKRVAFDAEKGRLWAVCLRCARWNLAPIEERWEAVEDAERRFAGSRLRVHSENIGLAKLADGTRLVRIGKALPRELAAWRYGETLSARRNRYLMMTAAGGVVTLAISGLQFVTMAGLGVSLAHSLGRFVRRQIANHRTLYELPRHASRTKRIVLTRRDLPGARLSAGSDGGTQVELPCAAGYHGASPLVVRGEEARRLLERTLVLLNANGARRGHVDVALDALHRAGGAEGFIAAAAREGRALVGGAPTLGFHPSGEPMKGPSGLGYFGVLALEMALHEESERRALEGELTLLEAAWRNAEEIAGIADRLALAPEASTVGAEA